jgi:hypothetical protein
MGLATVSLLKKPSPRVCHLNDVSLESEVPVIIRLFDSHMDADGITLTSGVG